MTFTKKDQRDKIRAQLQFELFGAAKSKSKPKKPDKSPVAINKKASKKAKFLQNPHKKPARGDVQDYMPATKRDH